MTSVVECPRLNNLTSNPGITTINNFGDPRLTSYDRTVDTTVTLRCPQDALSLIPNHPVLTCQSNGQWNGTIPRCLALRPTTSTTTTEPPDPLNPAYLSEEQKLIIGITGGIGAFIFVILVILIVAICILQRRAKKRQADQERVKGTVGTDVTSLPSLYALDNRPFSVDKTYIYQYHPSTYSSRDHYLDRQPRGTKLAPLALPQPSYGYDVYNNPAFRSDEDDVMATRNKHDVLDVIARERLDQLKSDREKFQKRGLYRIDDFALEAPRRDGKNYAQRDIRNTSSEAAVRAQRTLQYVEEHSNSSPSPSYLHGDQDVYQSGAYRGQGRYDDRYGQGPYFEDRRDAGLYHANYTGQGRYREEIRGERAYLDNYERRYLSNPRDGAQYSRESRLPPKDYSAFQNVRDQNLQIDRRDHSRYASGSARDLISDGKLWRPPTKTHFTGNRFR